MYWVNTVFVFVARIFFTAVVGGYFASLCLAMVSAQDTPFVFVGLLFLAAVIYFSIMSFYKAMQYFKERLENAN